MPMEILRKAKKPELSASPSAFKKAVFAGLGVGLSGINEIPSNPIPCHPMLSSHA